jgi:hypothetical protein
MKSQTAAGFLQLFLTTDGHGFTRMDLPRENTARQSRNQTDDNLLLHMQQKVARHLAIRFMAGPGRKNAQRKILAE